MSAMRVDFYGPDKKVLFTVTLPDLDVATELVEAILVYDVYHANGPFSMTLWVLGFGTAVEYYTYMFQAIPENTVSAFERFNLLYSACNVPLENSEEHDQTI